MSKTSSRRHIRAYEVNKLQYGTRGKAPSRCPHLHIESGTANGAEVFRCKACRKMVERVADGSAFVAASKGEGE